MQGVNTTQDLLLCTCRSGLCKQSIICHLSQELLQLCFDFQGENSTHSFLKDCLPDYNPQVGSSKIFHFFLRLTFFLNWRIIALQCCVYNVFTMGFSGGLASKESTCNSGNMGSIPGLERSPGEGTGYPLQYSGLENSMYCIVHGVAKNQT